MNMPIPHPELPLIYQPKRWQSPFIGYFLKSGGRMSLLMQLNFFGWFYGCFLAVLYALWRDSFELYLCVGSFAIALVTEIVKRIARSAGERYILCAQAIQSYSEAHGMFHLLESICNDLADHNDRAEVINDAIARINDVTGDADEREAAADLVQQDNEMVSATPEQFDAALKEFLKGGTG